TEEELSPKLGSCGYEKRFMFPVDRCQLKWKRRTCFWPSFTCDEIDKISAIGFPTIFALFNIVYWSYYISKAADAVV
ncbi:gamma-aminobutyric acid receptor subunit beta, partial [Aphelenchoides avenae]